MEALESLYLRYCPKLKVMAGLSLGGCEGGNCQVTSETDHSCTRPSVMHQSVTVWCKRGGDNPNPSSVYIPSSCLAQLSANTDMIFKYFVILNRKNGYIIINTHTHKREKIKILQVYFNTLCTIRLEIGSFEGKDVWFYNFCVASTM